MKARRPLRLAGATAFIAAVSFLLLLLLAFVPAVAGCGGAEEEVDPQAVLAASSAAMKQIDGFHFVYEVHQPAGVKPGMGLEIARITGDVNSDGNMQAVIDVTQAGIPLSLSFVAVGDTHYVQDPLSGQWQSIPAASSPVGTLSLSAGTIRILDRITDTTFEGEESKGGVKTYHISGKVAAAEVEAIAGAVDTENEFPTDIWVGIEDDYVYEVDIHGAATPNEDPDIWRSIVLSEHNVYVDIQPPE
jgi:hypothetical protein